MDKQKDGEEKLNIGIEYPERRFGVIAIEKQFITVDQLYDALVKQRGQNIEGRGGRSIGMILKDMGYLTMQQINDVLGDMKKESFEQPEGARSNTVK